MYDFALFGAEMFRGVGGESLFFSLVGKCQGRHGCNELPALNFAKLKSMNEE